MAPRRVSKCRPRPNATALKRKEIPVKQLLRDALDERGYSALTPVQTAVIAPEYEGRDLLVSAQTGSGKTVGFGLAIAPALLDEDAPFEEAGAPLGLVIAPTRELALQVKRELAWLYGKAGVRMASCVGGMDMRDERRALARGAHIVAATPGRLRDHIMRGSIDLSALKAVVLDEADEMLDLGFREDLEFILGEAPKERQTLLFSATVPKSIAQLAQSYQKDAERIIAKSESKQHSDISYKAMLVAPNDTENAVINTLLYHKAPNAIVFANTRAMVNRMTTRLSNRGFQVVALSGELSQAERSHALQAMRDGRAQVCVATDVAARGIDLPNLDLVVHAELPSNSETLLHRSGRTGRAGRKGVSALIVTKRARKKAERILKGAKLDAEWTTAPSADAVHTREQERMMDGEDWQKEIDEAEAENIAKLQERFSAEQIAAAYLRLYRSIGSAPEELSDVDAPKTPRAPFGPSVWFSIAGGRRAGAEPRRLLPALCNNGGLNKDDIGAIRVQADSSYVEIAEGVVEKFLAAIGPDMEVEKGVVARRLDKPPFFEKSSYERSGPGGAGGRGGKPGGKPGSKPRGKPYKKDGDRPERKPYKKDGDRPDRKPYKADADKRDRKPREERDEAVHSTPKKRTKAPRNPDKPKGPPPPKGKPKSKKNKARAAAKAAAKRAAKTKKG